MDDVQVDDMRAFTAFPVLLAKVRADAAPGPAAAAPAPRASKLFAGEFAWRTSEGGRLLEYSKIDAEVAAHPPRPRSTSRGADSGSGSRY